MRMEWEQLKRQVFGQKKIYLLGLRLLFYLGGNLSKLSNWQRPPSQTVPSGLLMILCDYC